MSVAYRELPKGVPVGYRPQRQNVRRVAVVGVSEWARTMAHGLDDGSRDLPAEIYSLILANPGCKISDLERETGKSKGGIKSALSRMDMHGFLIYEDDYAGLYPFSVVSVEAQIRLANLHGSQDVPRGRIR